MFALLLCKLCLRECSLKDNFVGQLNLCGFVIRTPFVLQAYFSKRSILAPPFIFKMFYFPKQEPRPILEQKLYQDCVFLKVKGYSVVIPLFYKTTIL
jgi:hypothetical protein